MSGATLDISEARKQFSSLDQRLNEEPVVYITKHNRKVFAVVNLEYLSTVLETMEILSDPHALRMLEDSLEDIRQGRLHDHDDVEEELG